MAVKSTVQPLSPSNYQAVTVKQYCTRSPLCVAWSILLTALISAAVASILVGLLVSRLQSSTSTIISTSTRVTTLTVITTTVTTATTTTTTTRTTTVTTATTTTTRTTTSSRPLSSITAASDFIVAIFNTSAGQSTGGFNGTFTSGEDTDNALDGSLSTKYLNYGSSTASNTVLDGPGIDTGFILTPRQSNASVATGLQFATANDAPDRDPLAVTLEGSNATSLGTLNSGASWNLIYNGSTGIDPLSVPPRSTYMVQQNFSNTVAYRSYRLLVTAKRAEDHHRSNNQNSNYEDTIDSTPIHIIYPDSIGPKRSPSVPPCHKQEMIIDGSIDQQVVSTLD